MVEGIVLGKIFFKSYKPTLVGYTEEYNKGSINCNSRCRQTWSNTYVQEAPAARSTEAPEAWYHGGP